MKEVVIQFECYDSVFLSDKIKDKHEYYFVDQS